MSSRLNRITDWDTRARKAKYRVAALAKVCSITERQLRRFIHDRFGISPHVWMTRVRLEKSPAMLSQGKMVKEVAAEVGFMGANHFSREFKKRYKLSPNVFRASRS